MQHVFELTLLELEMFLFQCSLFACLGRCFGLAGCGWALKHKALVNVSDKVVIHVLSVIFLDLGATCLLVVGYHGTG